jgi:light-regulated signal transduction histidine kinase (bacteriophytochrome)
LEQRVAERTSELRATVAELDAFSYSVAHDLRAPVLRIIGFSDALLNFYGEQLNDEARNYLKRLYEAGSRMGRMIDSLLSLSRLTRAKVQRDLVDLSAVVQGMLTELQEADPERRARFIVAPRVVASADRELIRALLDNLLRNAWKFTSKHASATIEFGTTQVGNETAYFVRDDGAGFDMSYADKLFGAFQRLHTADEFAGTGIGLATASRVVQRHGGRIWAEGKVEKGATIYFTLQAPAREVAPAGSGATEKPAPQHPEI